MSKARSSLMGRGSSEIKTNSKAFARGKAKRMTLKVARPGDRLGFSMVHETRSGAGTHEPSKKRRHKDDRRKAKDDLRRGDW